MEEEIFKKSEINTDILIEDGFKQINDSYYYEELIVNNNFKVEIIYKNDKIKGKIIDNEIGEELLNYRVENITGEFINNIKNEYIKILKDIRKKCSKTNNYISNQANRIANKINEIYGDIPEYLWKDDVNSVFRNPNNKKWYGIIMYINKEKLGAESKKVEVMNVKLPQEMIESLLKRKEFYKAYHMNKKYWITFILDESISDEEIVKLIEISHSYTVKNN